jgi:site-specific DNA-methyltransferase (adenine-specific)
MNDIENWINKVHQGNARDVLKEMPEESVDAVMTSPPYWNMRDYGVEGELGSENTFEEYIENLADICDEIKRVIKPKGSFWLNLGDKYQKNKNKLNLPYRVAIELQRRGWIERNDVTWVKKDPMPTSAPDRLNTTTEVLFHFVKNKKYFYNLDSVREAHSESTMERIRHSVHHNHPEDSGVGISKTETDKMGERFAHPNGKNPGDVIEITTSKNRQAHFATYPVKLCDLPIKTTVPANGILLDPFIGSGTTAIAAENQNRKWIGIDLNKDYVDMSYERIEDETAKIFDDRSVFDY